MACFSLNRNMPPKFLSDPTCINANQLVLRLTLQLSLMASPSVSDSTLYRSLIGALQYLTFTRLDITYLVHLACLHTHDPREPHVIALKLILCYIQGTLDHGL